MTIPISILDHSTIIHDYSMFFHHSIRIHDPAGLVPGTASEEDNAYLEFVPALHVLLALLRNVVVLVLDVSDCQRQLVFEELSSICRGLGQEGLELLYLLLVDSAEREIDKESERGVGQI